MSIWNRSLTASEAQSLMTNAPAANASGLVAYWPLNEKAGTTAFDISINGCNGTLLAAPMAPSRCA
jgi:hypothetical protein